METVASQLSESSFISHFVHLQPFLEKPKSRTYPAYFAQGLITTHITTIVLLLSLLLSLLLLLLLLLIEQQACRRQLTMTALVVLLDQLPTIGLMFC